MKNVFHETSLKFGADFIDGESNEDIGIDEENICALCDKKNDECFDCPNY